MKEQSLGPVPNSLPVGRQAPLNYAI